MPEVPEELGDRPPRSENVEQAPPTELANCLRQASANPEMALDTAQRWREGAQSQLEMAQSAHCLGLALVQSNRMNEAREAFELASAEAPADNPTYSARLAAMAGNAAMAQGDAESALPLLDRAGELALSARDNELGADLRVDLARVLVRLNRTEDAASALAEAREADPLDAQAWLLSATLSRRLERLGEAQNQIERAATLAPRDAQVGLEAGVIAAMSGRARDARASFQSVIDVAPDSPEAGRAQTYLEQLDASATE
ncbi:tetratricopeptide repeat protein [Erythrobacter vulgaris]|uniref:Tetratricopeptide repeat protein n=2 Tax=Qipengyuania vulgaris TaxID=291985 RepID=A0A844XS53_9SPHN|nr:tetratricopeptide repeat protein [Qipengyuania vulgaris]